MAESRSSIRLEIVDFWASVQSVILVAPDTSADNVAIVVLEVSDEEAEITEIKKFRMMKFLMLFSYSLEFY